MVTVRVLFCKIRPSQPTCITVKQHRLPSSLVPHWIQVLFPCDGLYPNPMQVPKLGSKMSQHWTSICLTQALGFPCSVCKDLLSDRALLWLLRSTARSQNLSSHEKLSSKAGKNLTFSLLFWGISTGRTQPAALLLHPRL